MGELDIQVKVLKQGTPVFFTWLNNDTSTIEGYLLTCSCQNLGLSDSSSMKSKRAGRSNQLLNFCSEISPLTLAKALHVAEIVTISTGAETRSVLGLETSCKRWQKYETSEWERKMSRDGEGESEDVDDFKSGGRGPEDGGGAGLEDDSYAADVKSMSLKDDSDIDADQIEGIDGDEGSVGEDSVKDLKVNEGQKGDCEEDGTDIMESCKLSDSFEESHFSCEGSSDAIQRKEREFITKDEERLKLSLDGIQEGSGDSLKDDTTKDFPNGGDKRNSMAEEKSEGKQTDMGAHGERGESQSKDSHCDHAREEVSIGDIISPSNVETRSEMVTEKCEKLENEVDKGGADDQETEDDPISENVNTIQNSENGQEVANGHQVQQSNLVTEVIHLSSLSADSIVILDESKGPISEMDSALYQALKGIMGAHLTNNDGVASRWQRQSEPSQTKSKIFTASGSVPLMKQDPVHAINTPAMIKYREHKNEEYLKKLHKLHSKDDADSIVCEFCGAILNSKNLTNHIAAFHSTDTRERRYHCELCGKTYLRNENLQRHMSIHTGSKFRCEHCEKSFQHEYSLRAHEKTHWETPPPIPIRKPKYRTLNPRTRRPCDETQQDTCPIVRKSKQVSCRVCGKTVSCKSLSRHLRTIHNVSSDNDRPTRKKSGKESCVTCGKTVSRKSIKRHLRLHTGTQPKREVKLVVCEICRKVLRKSSMKTHLETHNPKMSKCEICGKFVRNGSKYGHAKLHTDKREHACSYCELRFHFRSSLVAHIRKHTKERPIPCRYCEQTFPRYEARNIHERLHTGERPYKCVICQKDWRDRASYSHHMRKHHPGAPMQMKLWPPPTPTLVQSDIQQDTQHDPREITGDISL